MVFYKLSIVHFSKVIYNISFGNQISIKYVNQKIVFLVSCILFVFKLNRSNSLPFYASLLCIDEYLKSIAVRGDIALYNEICRNGFRTILAPSWIGNVLNTCDIIRREKLLNALESALCTYIWCLSIQCWNAVSHDKRKFGRKV